MEKLIVYKNYERLRDENHMTDYYVSKKTHINRSCFTSWRKGTAPSRNSLERLAEFFGVKCNDFYKGA